MSAPALHDAPAPLGAGDLLAGRYRIERVLGEGGMGVVWAAVDEHAASPRRVAVKLLKRTEPDHKKRFLREARIASALRHPNIVEVHDILELPDGTPAMVMDLLVGESLAERLARDRVLPLGELATFVTEVASAVGAAHARGVVHRDLKPENVFLAAAAPGSGGAPTVKVLDFGIAKLTAAEGDVARTAGLTNTGAVMGTPYYMAPEQVFGEKAIDHRADVWALGVIVYEALTGVRPIDGENYGQIFKAITMDDVVPIGARRPDLPPAVAQLVGRMLSRDKNHRPSGLTEVCAVFAPLAGVAWAPFGAPAPLPAFGSVPPPSGTPVPSDVDALGKTETPDALVMAAAATHARATSPKRRSSWRLVAAVVGALVVLGGGAATTWRFVHARLAANAAPHAADGALLASAGEPPPPASTALASVAQVASGAQPSAPSGAASSLDAPSLSPSSAMTAKKTGAARAHAAASASGAPPASKLPGGIHAQSPY